MNVIRQLQITDLRYVEETGRQDKQLRLLRPRVE